MNNLINSLFSVFNIYIKPKLEVAEWQPIFIFGGQCTRTEDITCKYYVYVNSVLYYII